MTVGQLTRSISGAELTEWLAFYHMEPFGGQADDWRAGLYAWMKANSVRDGKPPLPSPAVLFPWGAEPEEEPDPMKIIELFEQAAREEKLRG